MLLLAQLLLILMQSWEAKGVCCPRKRICVDGTFGSPCCAYRSCNIFCCNCGKCRTRWILSRQRTRQSDDDCDRRSRNRSKLRYAIPMPRPTTKPHIDFKKLGKLLMQAMAVG
ncbi:hypothetical protein ACLKA6_000739 [Drosophila palustris]